ncbi:hypothetical protein N0V92_004650 [Colletotrichum tropicale]|nr:hypothetical protein N0V92_004650 [Colletotrichum tropicale]
MVVIEDLPQIRVAVRITGSDSDCVEYDDPDPPITPSVGGTAQHSVAKIIQSEDDAEFFVHYRIENSLVENRKDKLKEDMEAAKHLGVIEVVVRRMVHLGPSQFRAQSVNFQSELAKKALIKSTVTHGTSYKSGTILENEGIIQRDDLPEASVPPRLSPLHDNLTIDDLSQEKIRRLAQERLDDLNAVKREERVKREGSSHPDMRPSKVYKVDPDGAIDLTDE